MGACKAVAKRERERVVVEAKCINWERKEKWSDWGVSEQRRGLGQYLKQIWIHLLASPLPPWLDTCNEEQSSVCVSDNQGGALAIYLFIQEETVGEGLMDGYEASRIVLSRIQKVDPENASRIMGLVLIQDHGDKEMIRLAFGPESLLHSVILKSRNHLGLSSPTLPASPFFSRHTSSRLLVPPPLTIPTPHDLLTPNSYNINSSPLPFYHHDLSFLNDDGDGDGFGWKPCLYYARGYCKNGGSCRFLHGGDAAAASPYSPSLLLQHKDSQIRRNELMVSPASRQIYLTFPADSSFREEDVSNYFSIYGPVQDVRIPYQQKRMFGFVTFVYPETVKLILAKGNPHFVCDARVLVKPYKEKPKLTLPPENNNCRKQQMERGGDLSPSALDSFDLSSPGGGMFYNSSQDMMWTRNMEEQALEVQSRRLMNLQLLDVKKHHHHQRALSIGSPIPSPTLFSPRHPTASDQQMGMSNACLRVSTGKESPVTNSNAQESLEHNLPDSPFASPTKASSNSNYFTAFSNSNDTGEAERAATNSNSSPTLLPPSSLDMASFQSFNCQPSRFSSGHGAIGMFGCTGGSTFPVGI